MLIFHSWGVHNELLGLFYRCFRRWCLWGWRTCFPAGRFLLLFCSSGLWTFCGWLIWLLNLLWRTPISSWFCFILLFLCYRFFGDGFRSFSFCPQWIWAVRFYLIFFMSRCWAALLKASYSIIIINVLNISRCNLILWEFRIVLLYLGLWCRVVAFLWIFLSATDCRFQSLWLVLASDFVFLCGKGNTEQFDSLGVETDVFADLFSKQVLLLAKRIVGFL